MCAKRSGSNRSNHLSSLRPLASTVVADGFHRAAFHRLPALYLLLLVVGLFVDEGISPVVVAGEAGWCSLAAEITVDALFIHKKFAGDIVLVFVFDFSHVAISYARSAYHGTQSGFKRLRPLRR